MIPEQVWDAAGHSEARTLPRRSLRLGHAAGLGARGVHQAAPFAARRARLRSCRRKRCSATWWKRPARLTSCGASTTRCDTMPAGKTLRIETLASAVIHWSADGWATAHDTETLDTGLGVHVGDLPTEALPQGAQIVFTFLWPEAGRWEGEDFTVQIY